MNKKKKKIKKEYFPEDYEEEKETISELKLKKKMLKKTKLWHL